MTFDPMSMAQAGSAATGAFDFGVGNLIAMANFLKSERAAQHARLTGERVHSRAMARLGGDRNWMNLPVSVRQHEAMQAVWRDLMPFGLGDFLAGVLSPPQRGDAPGAGGMR